MMMPARIRARPTSSHSWTCRRAGSPGGEQIDVVEEDHHDAEAEQGEHQRRHPLGALLELAGDRRGVAGRCRGGGRPRRRLAGRPCGPPLGVTRPVVPVDPCASPGFAIGRGTLDAVHRATATRPAGIGGVGEGGVGGLYERRRGRSRARGSRRRRPRARRRPRRRRAAVGPRSRSSPARASGRVGGRPGATTASSSALGAGQRHLGRDRPRPAGPACAPAGAHGAPSRPCRPGDPHGLTMPKVAACRLVRATSISSARRASSTGAARISDPASTAPGRPAPGGLDPVATSFARVSALNGLATNPSTPAAVGARLRSAAVPSAVTTTTGGRGELAAAQARR